MRNKPSLTAYETILGIDPGFDRLGWAVAKRQGEQWSAVELGCIETNRQQSTTQRYQQLETDLQAVINKYQPTQTAVETLFFANNVTTAMRVSETRGIIIALLMRNQLLISQYNPMKIKEAVTGDGKADKKAVEKMVRIEFGLTDKKVLDDAIDALAVVLTHQILSKNLKYYA